MKKIVCSIFVVSFLLVGSQPLFSQIVYGVYSGGSFVVIDLGNCTSCNVFEVPNAPASPDVTVLPSGEVLVASGGGTFSVYSPPSQTPTIYTIAPSSFISGTILFNGLVYLYAVNGLHIFDPTTGQTTYVGPWASGMPPSSEFFISGGLLYTMETGSSPNDIWLVNIADPSASTLTQSLSFGGSIGSLTSVGSSIVFADDDWVNNYDFTSNTSSQVCNLLQMGIPTNLMGLSYLPVGVPVPPCLCETDAGTVQNTSLEICLPGSATVPFNNDEELDGDDLLQYILFSDLTDTLGSILVVSNTPNIAFNPATMQTGVTYYLATIAGDDLNGNVDLNDDCLSISNASEVIWHPQPSVSFAAPNPDVCVGGCIALEVTLTGTPPFGLTGEILAGANVVGTFNENYLQNNGTLNACAPFGTAPGSLSVQATNLSDANCSCL